MSWFDIALHVPNEPGEYIVCDGNWVTTARFYGKTGGGLDDWETASGICIDVEYWQHLPLPPGPDKLDMASHEDYLNDVV